MQYMPVAAYFSSNAAVQDYRDERAALKTEIESGELAWLERTRAEQRVKELDRLIASAELDARRRAKETKRAGTVRASAPSAAANSDGAEFMPPPRPYYEDAKNTSEPVRRAATGTRPAPKAGGTSTARPARRTLVNSKATGGGIVSETVTLRGDDGHRYRITATRVS